MSFSLVDFVSENCQFILYRQPIKLKQCHGNKFNDDQVGRVFDNNVAELIGFTYLAYAHTHFSVFFIINLMARALVLCQRYLLMNNNGVVLEW